MINPICRALAPVLAAVLVACGGGGADAPASSPGPSPSATATATAESAATPAASGISLADYLAARDQQASLQGFPMPSAAERASIFDHSRARALSMLAVQSAPSNNALVVPPLSESFVQLVAGAARGKTLAELLTRYPAELGPFAAAAQTQGVQRYLAAPANARFMPEFLAGSDSLGPLVRLGGWQAVVLPQWADLDRSEVRSRLPPTLPPWPTDNTRLMAWDAWAERVTWPRVEAFDGVFANELGGLQRVAMLRVTGPVMRHEGGTFTARALNQSGRWVLALLPRSGTLQEFVAQGRLDAALRDAVLSLNERATALWPTDELVLPVLPDLSLQAPPGWTDGDMPLLFDEWQADLRGLDGGGTYLRTGVWDRRLQIAASGLSVEGHQVVGFEFSRRNQFAPTSADLAMGGITIGGPFARTTWVGAPPACSHPTPDLRSFFLVLLDEQRRITALAAIGTLDGLPCQ